MLLNIYKILSKKTIKIIKIIKVEFMRDIRYNKIFYSIRLITNYYLITINRFYY